MLVLSRKPQEKIVIGGGITVTVVRIEGEQVKLGITAPDETNIRRAELLDETISDGPGDQVTCGCGQKIRMNKYETYPVHCGKPVCPDCVDKIHQNMMG